MDPIKFKDLDTASFISHDLTALTTSCKEFFLKNPYCIYSESHLVFNGVEYVLIVFYKKGMAPTPAKSGII
ncbi:hypothetical protein [Xanthocytophaga agilis]|uniref:Uncharacterized protein n=1 Tax=Xanthocytophaga agilis TaxID=3048010 RepID=A0AAE3RBN2_9BACT|nr:hypothetical protein [Xanthocytophaga agilis]MDJ1505209.1 hypothetical protein [Xanthocytophaga agilis]